MRSRRSWWLIFAACAAALAGALGWISVEMLRLERAESRARAEAEHQASDLVRKKEKLNWNEWAARVNDYLGLLESLFSPDLFILGGGVSKKHRKYLSLLDTQAQVVPAQLLNDAGIVGAALAAKALV